MDALELVFTPEELQGLGSTGRAVASKVVSKMAERFVTREQHYLRLKASELPEEVRARIKSGDIRYGDGMHYVRIAIANGTGNIVPVFSDSLNKQIGITNISKGRLSNLVNLALGRIEIRYAEAANTAKEYEVNYQALTPASSPAALLNAEIEFTVQGKVVAKLPASRFIESANNASDGYKDGFNLDTPYLIKENEDIQINIHIAGVMPSTADKKHFVEFVLRGAETRSR